MGWRAWTGVGERRWKKAPDEEVQPAKTLWDWLQLLIVPAILVGVTFAWSAAQTNSDNAREDRRIAADQAAAEEVRQDATLNDYFEQMSDLMLNKKLLSSNESDAVRSVARTVTLTALRRLDGKRKSEVVRFLDDARLIFREDLGLDDLGQQIWSVPVILLGSADLRRADLRGADLGQAGLMFTDLRGADLRDADLRRADLLGADLTGADLRGTNLVGAKLSSANLTSANHKGANLTGANLASANVRGGNLEDARLSRAFLAYANLTGANLAGADLIGANLFEAVLTDAQLTGAYLDHADLTRAYLDHADVTAAELPGANLSGARLRGADIRGANLAGANLTGANFARADLDQANLAGANLSGANLAGAQLGSANLAGAKALDLDKFIARIPPEERKAFLESQKRFLDSLSSEELAMFNLSPAKLAQLLSQAQKN